MTNTALSGGRLYWEGKVGFFNVKGVSIPVAGSVFPDGVFPPPRRWAERAYPKLIHYNRLEPRGPLRSAGAARAPLREVRARGSVRYVSRPLAEQKPKLRSQCGEAGKPIGQSHHPLTAAARGLPRTAAFFLVRNRGAAAPLNTVKYSQCRSSGKSRRKARTRKCGAAANLFASATSISPPRLCLPMAGVTDTVFRRFISNLGGCGLIDDRVHLGRRPLPHARDPSASATSPSTTTSTLSPRNSSAPTRNARRLSTHRRGRSASTSSTSTSAAPPSASSNATAAPACYATCH